MLSVAPMIQWTDRYWRNYFRLISRKTNLYTEMTMDTALTYNPNKLEDFIGFSEVEEPLVIQLGGSDPITLGEAAYLCESFGRFTAINLNCGCPSNKAKRACFGAELMLEPEKVREILSEMIRRVTSTPVTVKCRLGVTGREEWTDLLEFVRKVSQAGVRQLIVHARSCVLKGLSPAQNRTIPPLNYEWVYRLVSEFPELSITLNGGITSLTSARELLGVHSSIHRGVGIDSFKDDCKGSATDIQAACLSEPTEWTQTSDCKERGFVLRRGLHGVMVGREAYNNPFLFSQADTTFFGAKRDPCQDYSTRRAVLEQYLEFVAEAEARNTYGCQLCTLAKPLHNLFAHQPCNHAYKRAFDEQVKIWTVKKKCNGENETEALTEAVWESIRLAVPIAILDAPICSEDNT